MGLYVFCGRNDEGMLSCIEMLNIVKDITEADDRKWVLIHKRWNSYYNQGLRSRAKALVIALSKTEILIAGGYGGC